MGRYNNYKKMIETALPVKFGQKDHLPPLTLMSILSCSHWIIPVIGHPCDCALIM